MPSLKPVGESHSSRSFGVCIVLSMLLHAGFLLVPVLSSSPITVELTFQLPSEVEFGIAEGRLGGGRVGAPADGVETAPEPTQKQQVVRQTAPPQPEKEIAVIKRISSSKPKPVVPSPDAGNPEPVDTSGPLESPDLKVEDRGQEGELDGFATAPGEGGLHGLGPGGLYGDLFGSGQGPAGAHMALRLDMDLIRKSTLLLEVGPLLDVIPGWKRLLRGSGIHPLDHLKRILVASPNLERSRIVVSAQHRQGDQAVRKAAAKLANARHQVLKWDSREGHPTAPWLTTGKTERVVALLGANEFAVTRGKDLPTVLAVSRALASRPSVVQPKSSPPSNGGALLAMSEGEAMVLTVEGARHYVKDKVSYVPTRLRIALKEEPADDRNLLVARGNYESVAQAIKALAKLHALRDLLIPHREVALSGLRSAIEEALIEREQTEIRIQMELTLHQTRYLLGFLRQALMRYAN